MGRRLPSAGEVLIIRPAGIKGSAATPSTGLPLLSRVPARKPGIPSRIRTQCGPDGMQLLLRV